MSFTVDTDAMSRAAGQIGAAADEIDVVLGKLRQDVGQMLAGWQSDGATAHERMHVRFDADMTAINTNLRQMQAALQSTHTLYVTQETEQNSDHVGMRNVIAQ